jgi:hypothetical protein
METFRRVVETTRFFWCVMGCLDWNDALNLYQAFDEVRALLDQGETGLCHLIGAGKRSKSRMLLDGSPIGFKEYMVLWHWFKHSAGTVLPPPVPPDPRFELVVDVYLPVNSRPPIASWCSSCCCFLSPEAPPPFQGAFVVVDRKNRLVIFSPRDKAFLLLLRESVSDGPVFALAPSPGGSTILICACDGSISLCKLLPGKAFVRRTSISLWTLDLPRHSFAGENSFVLRTGKRAFDVFTAEASTAGIGPPSRSVFMAVREPHFVPALSSLYDPGSQNRPEFILLEKYDCDRMPFVRCRCHSFEICVYPSGGPEEQRWFTCVLADSSVIDWTFSRRVGKAYIVALTSMEEDMFFSLVPFARRDPRQPRPGEVCGQNMFRECNLAVYSVSLEGFDGNKERRFVRVEPMFYVPNNKKFADYPLALESIPRRNYFVVRSFSSASLTMYKIKICDYFLVVAHKHTLLLFPLRGKARSLAVGFCLAKPFDVFDFSEDARFAAFLQGWNNENRLDAGAVRLCSFCPACSPLFPRLPEIDDESWPPSAELEIVC